MEASDLTTRMPAAGAAQGAHSVGTFAGQHGAHPRSWLLTGSLLLAAPASAQQATVTLNYTGSEQQWTVPSGVTSVQVTAVGAAGGTVPTTNGGHGGAGAQVSGTISVSPGQTLYVEVGGVGGQGGSSPATAAFNGGGAGGIYNAGTANIHDGAAGGGATDVRTSSAANGGSLPPA